MNKAKERRVVLGGRKDLNRKAMKKTLLTSGKG